VPGQLVPIVSNANDREFPISYPYTTYSYGTVLNVIFLIKWKDNSVPARQYKLWGYLRYGTSTVVYRTRTIPTVRSRYRTVVYRTIPTARRYRVVYTRTYLRYGAVVVILVQYLQYGTPVAVPYRSLLLYSYNTYGTVPSPAPRHSYLLVVYSYVFSVFRTRTQIVNSRTHLVHPRTQHLWCHVITPKTNRLRRDFSGLFPGTGTSTRTRNTCSLVYS
jgi:hypothetical protein